MEASQMNITIGSDAFSNKHSNFKFFSELPPEIRSQIWRAALTSRIIKWTRKHGNNIFTAPLKSPFLANVCRESREAALLYGEYINLSTASTPLYFSLLIDYLIFDPGWRHLTPHPQHTSPQEDPLDSLPTDLLRMRNVMVHPNYTDDRKLPTTLFEKLRNLEQLLVVGDEKSIGYQSKFMKATIYDTTKYYETRNRHLSKVKVPHIAIGCLGWTGAERRRLRHGKEDDRKLVAIFDNDTDMKAHLDLLREEEWKFTQEQFRRTRPKFILKLRNPQEASSQQPLKTAPDYQKIPSAPPAYSELSTAIPPENSDAFK